jgi:hypothetical protein
MNLSQKWFSRLFFRDVDECGQEVESVMPALMPIIFIHFYLGTTLIFGEKEN